MTDRPTGRNVREGAAESDVGRRSGEGENAVPNYDPWVSFYGFLHRYVRRHTVVFGGSGTVGLLVLVRQLYALFSGPHRWSLLPSWLVVGGALSLAFGVGYYSVKDASTCRNCDAAFSKERVRSRPVWLSPESADRDQMYVEDTFECRECGNRTTEPHPYPDPTCPRT